MSVFHPDLNTRLTIAGSTYEFMPQQIFAGGVVQPYMVEGQEGFVYLLRDIVQQKTYALKVMKPAYRCESIALVTRRLAQYSTTPGFYLSRRLCLERPAYDELIIRFPDLEYAILMPWLSLKTWAGLIRSPEASTCYTPRHALDLASVTASVLYAIESRRCTHTDIAGRNIMYSPDFKQVELLDLEGMYMPDLPLPKQLSYGSPGYQHRKSRKQGQWCQIGDRFAGAILLTEMLTWWHPMVRAQTPGNATSIFLPEELQTSQGSCWQSVRDVLWSLHPTLLALFDQAWASTHLEQCPDFATWLSCLSALNPKFPTPSSHPAFQ